MGPEGVVHVAWADTTAGETHPDIYYVWGENQSWTKPINISKSACISSYPTLACDNGKVLLAWSDNSKKETAGDIWLAIASKTGKFANPINISATPGVSSEPIVATDNGRLAVVWSDTTAGVKGPNIYARVSPDTASNFSKVMNVSNTQRMAIHPHVTIAGGKVIVIWEELGAAGEESTIKVSATQMKGLATGPASPVDPTVHRMTGKVH